jgi:hypothetical protein
MESMSTKSTGLLTASATTLLVAAVALAGWAWLPQWLGLAVHVRVRVAK